MRYPLRTVLLLCLVAASLAIQADAVVKIMPLGDSITRGGTAADTPYASYRYYLDESLRASGYGVDFVGSLSSGYTKFVFDQQHDGHGGYTTGMMVGSASFSPLRSWLAASPTPEIVLLHAGTNDAILGIPLATRLQNVESIVGILRQKNPHVRVMVAKVIPTADATRNAQQIAPFNAALPTLAARLSTAASPVAVVDLAAGYDGVADNQPDGIHPKTTGERKMAAAWQRALAPVLAAAPVPTTTVPTTVPTTRPTTVAPARNAVPGTIEAEDYAAGGEGVGYHDLTAANQGGAYRNDAVDIEAIPGGYAVGYVRTGEWLAYSVPVASAGKYTATFRVASWGTAPHAIEVLVNGNPAATVAVPTTGSYDAWTTATATLTLPAGTCSLRLRFVGDGQNLDRVVVSPVAPTTAPTTAKPTTTAPPLKGRAVPGTIEAEDYNTGGEGVAYHDTTPTNLAGAYRNDAVDIEAIPGGYTVCYVRNGEWLAYTAGVASAGKYTATFRVASWGTAPHAIEVLVNGNPAATVAVPNTGSHDAWTTATAFLTLPAGTCSLRLRFVGDGQNLDRVVVSPVAVTTTAKPTTTVPTTVPTTPVVTPGGTYLLPDTIQAEDYLTGGEGVGYHDTTAGNQGGAYRSDGVDVAYASAIGSYVVTGIKAGEWLEYSVQAPVERDYALTFRLSSASGGQPFALKVDGRSEVTVIAPRTGASAAYTSISTQLRLARGVHRLRIEFGGEGLALDSFELA